MNNETLTTAAFLGAVVVPPIVSLLKREHWPTQLKVMISMLICMAFTLLQLVLDHHIHSFGDAMAQMSVVYASSQTMYHMYFVGSVGETALAEIGSKTV